MEPSLESEGALPGAVQAPESSTEQRTETDGTAERQEPESAQPEEQSQIETPKSALTNSIAAKPPVVQTDLEKSNSALSPGSRKSIILHVLCVSFHHRNGPQVEFALPAFPGQKHDNDQIEADGSRAAVELPEEWSFLPFLCLPDGAHAAEEEFIYFHLPPVKSWSNYHQSTIFGLACFRQIAASELLIKSAEVTRSSVQKAVVILATEPVLGSIRTTLRLVTQALFAQRDFTKMDILENLYESLVNSVAGSIADANLYTGLSLREIIHKFKGKTLQLFKLLFLEKRVLFFGHRVEQLSSYQYSLLSLFPDLLRHLEDVGSPLLSYFSTDDLRSEVVAESPRIKYQRYGLPLRLFGEGAFFQPYIPLQQVDVLMSPTTKSFLVGSSNAIFLHNKSCGIDAIVNVDNGTLEITDSALSSAVSLTGADKRFIDEIVKGVTTTWCQEDAEDPTLNSQICFEGSDDDIRSRFETYFLRLLASVKYSTQPPAPPAEATDGAAPQTAPAKPRDVLSDFNTNFIKAWQQTHNYKLWTDRVSSDVNTGEPIGHPKEGTSTIALLSSSVAQKFSEFSKSISSGGTNSPAAERAATPSGDSKAEKEKSYQLSRSLPNASSMLSSMSTWMTRRREGSSNSSTVPRAVPTSEEESSMAQVPMSSLSLDEENFVQIDL
ncbi:late secretory pathway protein avl9 [Phlyctochytrium bullatum]|nr:late secretory pathway protein avl9 [Phlyctochytrium bullatum]